MKRILIVDDVPGWVRFHEQNIRHLNIPNIEIDTANSAREALSKLEVSIDNPYDVIFTDLQMESDFLPKYAGEWLIEQIKTFKEYNSTKIVIISASPNIRIIAERNQVLYLSKTIARNADSESYRAFLEY
ncbi:response regulator receiver domain protein [Clostridium sp. CAG:813]|nr:response regulator receiver domain protein [Clostridium sp. CAG:813]